MLQTESSASPNLVLRVWSHVSRDILALGLEGGALSCPAALICSGTHYHSSDLLTPSRKVARSKERVRLGGGLRALI